MVSRTKTPREILEEYERLAREREERRFNQVTNPTVRSRLFSMEASRRDSLAGFRPNVGEFNRSIRSIELVGGGQVWSPSDSCRMITVEFVVNLLR